MERQHHFWGDRRSSRERESRTVGESQRSRLSRASSGTGESIGAGKGKPHDGEASERRTTCAAAS